MTNDEMTTTDDNETRTRMRKRFQEIEEQQIRREEAKAAPVFVGYFGFLVTFVGALMMLFYLEIIPLTFEILLSIGVILFGVLIIAVALFLRNAPTLLMSEM
ncbi:MAG: hypothetical protein ACW98Y_11060 [Candidatus Thorarchaeota archaeon]